ncbi:hypothetical protein HPG69_017970 [Diceros bicornis minor]|uniref:Cation-transporting P-type ATPase C-terminal domain-containing protein n=1 Tax=Diceros bicornis minor TaxID=77932 RepID=A0A7J7F3S0_DICBM|nr:hypothetical protein HPG69_017970 [Diceros bicornis minor]
MAKAIAKSVGIISANNEKVEDIEKCLNTAMEETSPQQKLIIMVGCQRHVAVVVVTVDGVNDSPALKKADIGIAMGNIAELCPFLIYITVGLALPIGIIPILFINLGTDIIPSLPYLMRKLKKPHHKKMDRLVNKPLAMYACLHIGLGQWGKDSMNDWEDSCGKEWTKYQKKYLVWTGYTATLIGILMQQIAYLIIRKTWRNFIFQQGIWLTKALILSYDLENVTALNFTMLLAQDWSVCMPHATHLWVYNGM